MKTRPPSAVSTVNPNTSSPVEPPADLWTLQRGNGPVMATAIHDGHRVRPELEPLLLLSAEERLREEDPFTGQWAGVASTRVVGHRSRFEVDLNRPLEKAVYLDPADAWGLRVYRSPMPAGVVERSRAEHQAFYDTMRLLLKDLVAVERRVLVLDLHTYNHRRNGPYADPANPIDNPDVNIGTGTMSARSRWAPVIERFMHDLARCDVGLGRPLDVRENVKFRGGNFAAWMHQTFPHSVCVLSVEFKKFFMDEWTGEPDARRVAAIGEALQSTLPGLVEVLNSLPNGQET